MTSRNPDLTALSDGTVATYDRQAGFWASVRDDSLSEQGWLDRFTAGLPFGARLLDLGCGTGVPVAGYLLSQGFHVTGIDAAPAMIAMARDRFPAGDWHVADMRDLPGMDRFDGILSWDGFFHLTPEAQRRVLPDLCKRLRPGGRLLLTVGPEAGEVPGRVGDETVYHASLSEADYREILAEAGMDEIVFVREDITVGGRTVLMASR